MREKARRAREQNELLSQAKRRTGSTNTVQNPEQDDEASRDQATRTGDNSVKYTTKRITSNAAINEGDQVSSFKTRVNTGLKKKLSHRWNGPFRVKKQNE